MSSKMGIIVFGLLALLVVGAIASATASAEAGPFWHHRENSTEGNGFKIEPQTPETFTGTGGEQILKETVGTTPVLLKSPGVKITGGIWNNKLQGQIKLELKYSPITIAEPTLPGCQAEVSTQPGARNVVFAEGHLAWTWDGTAGQRTEQPIVNQKPDLIIVPPGTQIQENVTELPKGVFAEIKYSPTASCGVLAGTFKLIGSTIGSLKPEKIGEWNKTFTFNTPEGKAKQHFWNGKEFIGVETGLLNAGNAMSLIGEDKITMTKQEVAIFEK